MGNNPELNTSTPEATTGSCTQPTATTAATPQANSISGPNTYHNADGSPIDYQAAALLCQEVAGQMTCVGDTVYIYAEGFWQPICHHTLRRRVQATLRRIRCPRRGGAQVYGSHAQVLSTIDSFKTLLGQGPLLSADHQPRVIVFSNGTYNLDNGQLEDHDPCHWATFRLAFPYREGASCPPELQAVIERCYSPEAEPIVRAIIRWVVDPKIQYGQCVHLLGPSGSGKGLLLDFLRSLFPDELHGDLLCPSLLSSPESVHQHIPGKRLMTFPDCPTSFKGKKRWNTFYELIENKPVTTRRLYSGEAERPRRMNCRFVLASIESFQSSDGTDGFQRRAITLPTLPRQGDPDHSLVEDLQPLSERYALIRGEAVSWALSMPLKEVLSVLDLRDPGGLLRETAQEVTIASDILSQWVDTCLEPVPGPDGANQVVSDSEWLVLFDIYKAWCQFSCSPKMAFALFQGQVRRVLGPKRCLPRGKAPMADTPSGEVSQRPNLPRVDAGFRLRQNLGRDARTFNRLSMKPGGLDALAALPQAQRTAETSGS
jgi:energy-coupling factor transporter ATP-binding protein EcfA2